MGAVVRGDVTGFFPDPPDGVIADLGFVGEIAKQVDAPGGGSSVLPEELVVLGETQVVAFFGEALRRLTVDIDEDVVVESGLGRGVADRGIVQRERLPEKGAPGSGVVFRVVAGRLVEEPMEDRQGGVSLHHRNGDGAEILLGFRGCIRHGIGLRVGGGIEERRVGGIEGIDGGGGIILGEDAPADHFARQERGGGNAAGVDLIIGRGIAVGAIVHHGDGVFVLVHPLPAQGHRSGGGQRAQGGADGAGDDERGAAGAADGLSGFVRGIADERSEVCRDDRVHRAGSG